MQSLNAGDKKISYIRRRDHKLQKNETVANFQRCREQRVGIASSKLEKLLSYEGT